MAMLLRRHGEEAQGAVELAEDTMDAEVRLLRGDPDSESLQHTAKALEPALLPSPARCRVAARWLVLAGFISLIAVFCMWPRIPGRRTEIARLAASVGLDARSAATEVPQVDTATSCRSIGCFGNYDPDRLCQCNDKCGHYLNCCEDFIRACELELPASGEGKAVPLAAAGRAQTVESVLAPTPSPPPRTTKTTTVTRHSTTLTTTATTFTTTATETRLTRSPTTTTTSFTTSTPRPRTRKEYTRSTTAAPRPQPAPESSNVPRCQTREMCLRIVDLFLNGQPRSFGLLQALGNQKLGGGDCGASCGLPATCPEGNCGYITYDNAVAAIYYTKRGELGRAQEILDAFRRALYPEDLRLLRPRRPDALYQGRVSRQALTLLASSYAPGYRPVPGNYQRPYVTDGTVDAGSNAWVALAFAHYAAAAEAPCYANVAREILDALTQSSNCSDMLEGFLGGLPPKTGRSRSTEQNVVIYAAANLLGSHHTMEKARRFVQQMHGFGEAARAARTYAAGTGSDVPCDESTPDNAPLPAAASFWTMLSDVDPDKERMTDLVRYALKTPGSRKAGDAGHHGFWSRNQDALWMSGSGATPELFGFQYTDAGHGVQWETTASAVMALLHFKQLYGDKELGLQSHIDQARMSLSKLLGMYKGVPASVLGEDAQTSALPGSASGLGSVSMRFLTVAATAWTGLLFLYDETPAGTLREDVNPYAFPRSRVPFDVEETCWQTLSSHGM